MIFLIVYIVGYVAFLRNHMGFLAWSGAASYQKKLDSDDRFFGSIFGPILTLAWPLTVPGYLGYKAIKTHVKSDAADKLMPKPKPIETKDQRIKRQEKERAELIRKNQQNVNDKERELGIPVTKWDL